MKVLFLAPHLSTGGMPAFLLKRIEALLGYTDVEIFVIEWKCYSIDYTVQRNKIEELLGENFVSFFGEEKSQKTIIDFCYKKQIDIIHIEEIPEGFDTHNPFNFELQKELYDKKHPWKVIETYHNMYFKPDIEKKIDPDGYAFVTPYHLNNTFKSKKGKKSLVTFPIDPTIQYPSTQKELLEENGWLTKGEFHIINIGLWTPGKNQEYAIKLAKMLYEKYGWTYIFHFLGNQAPNFKNYWEPLMKDLPPNVFILGERSDINKYFKMADMMLFTSTWECNPIVLKEAISNNIKIMAHNLDHYDDEYLPFIVPLSSNLKKDKINLINTIHSPIKYKIKDYSNSVKLFADQHINLYKSVING
jgi:glycosyltransferase involved in cell wall biosynthesis